MSYVMTLPPTGVIKLKYNSLSIANTKGLACGTWLWLMPADLLRYRTMPPPGPTYSTPTFDRALHIRIDKGPQATLR